jgi:hypothetical protein
VIYIVWGIRDSVVGIANWLGPGRFGVRVPAGARRPDELRGPPSPLFSGCHGSFPGIKWLGREVGHSLPSSAEVKN